VAWSVDIDGTDITPLCQSITWSPKLSRPASVIVRYPGHLFSGAVEGESELHLYNGSLLFSGPVWFVQDDGTENATYTEVTAYDHLIYLNKRMCKTPAGWPDNNFPIHPPDPAAEPGPCNLADPSKVIADYITAPEILGAYIDATNACDGAWNITTGSVAAGGPDLTGVPADFPMNIQTMADMLLESGQLNILVNPGFGSSTVDLTNGGVVNDLRRTGAFVARTFGCTVDGLTCHLWVHAGDPNA
jgi:hypothetical protein